MLHIPHAEAERRHTVADIVAAEAIDRSLLAGAVDSTDLAEGRHRRAAAAVPHRAAAEVAAAGRILVEEVADNTGPDAAEAARRKVVAEVAAAGSSPLAPEGVLRVSAISTDAGPSYHSRP